MRPPRSDIAAPPLSPRVEWVNSKPQAMERLTAGGPVLVHFWECAELAPVRTLPYLSGWWDRYRPAGLTVLGIHSPRYPFNAGAAAVSAAADRLDVTYPVVVDDVHDVWTDYGCKGWPSLFLYAQGGALRWFHFGEGAYEDTEEAIRDTLREADSLRELPAQVGILRPADRPEALIARPTEEVRPGPGPEEPWVAGRGGDTLKIAYRAGGVHAVLEGPGTAILAIDGGPTLEFDVTAPGLHELIDHGEHQSHRMALRLDNGMALWALQFSPGLA